MLFKHPELLYALFLLLIPIIIHLFQLRKFKKELFTNVEFLKEVTIQTRKSSQIKKWLILCTRLLLFAALILAFAQPFTTKNKHYNSKNDVVIYLDNSFSMEAKGDKGELLKRSVQDIIANADENETISLFTNDDTYRNTSIKAIKNELLQIGYSSNQLHYDAALLKAKKLFSPNSTSSKRIVFISDFQTKDNSFNPVRDSLIDIHAVKLQPVNTNNIAIDSAYISNKTASQIELSVVLKNNGQPLENIPISLFDDGVLIAKTSASIDTKATSVFSLDLNEGIKGELIIDDASLQFDNGLFFNINKAPKINVLSINDNEDNFLRKIFTDTEFNYSSTQLNSLNYNILESQNLIVINELKTVPNSLITALKAFTNQGGSLIMIPSENASFDSYKAILSNYNIQFNAKNNSERKITTINYSHPLYRNVFNKRIENFQYPKVNHTFSVTSNTPSILSYEDGSPFLLQANDVFVFTSALNKDNSNFINSPLIVPTLFNIGKQSLKNSNLYFTIGNNNVFDVSASLQQNDILSLVNEDINMIPQQQYFNNKITLTTQEIPKVANTYAITGNEKILEYVSYNYNRTESNLRYQDISNLNQIKIHSSVFALFEDLKSNTKINELWKWFVIFALVFLIIEMLILKYFK